MGYGPETYVVTGGILFAIALMGVIAFFLLRKSKPENEYFAEVRRRRMLASFVFSVIFVCLGTKNIIQFLLAK